MTEAANDDTHDSAPEAVTTPDGRTVLVLRDRPIRLTASGRMDEDEAALYLGCRVRTMQRMRQQRRGPKYDKAAGKVMYAKHDLDEYLNDCTIDPLAS